MINFNNVTFSYKASRKEVLSNLSFNIRDGEHVWLNGPSGKGKTTVLRLITGLEKPRRGEVKVKEGAVLSVVFQEDRLIPFVCVEKNISLFSSEDKASLLLRELGLENCGGMMPDELSGGMKRRVALARALSKPFDLLILDEPLNGLDAEAAQKTIEVIKRYTENKTLVLVSHQRDEAKKLCQKEIVIE